MTDHPQITEQEYRWLINHLEEVENRLLRCLELVGEDPEGDTELAEAVHHVRSYQAYVAIQVRTAIDESTSD